MRPHPVSLGIWLILIYCSLGSLPVSESRAAAGSLDPSFGQTTRGYLSGATALAVQPDGKIVIGRSSGNVAHINFKSGILNRIHPDGTVDETFSVPQGLSGEIRAVTLEPDGSILLGGRFGLTGYAEGIGLVRIRPDGSLDTSFPAVSGIKAASPPAYVNAVLRQADGKLIIAGSFSSYAGSPCGRILRLNADGSRDSSFDSGTGFNGEVRCMALQKDGNILVSGSFSSFNGTPVSPLVRLQARGNRDSSFSAPVDAANILEIARQFDGKVLVAGNFKTMGGATVPGLARLNSDGSRDSSFNSSAITSTQGMMLQADGKIIVAGVLSGTFVDPHLCRLDSDGSLDSAFPPIKCDAYWLSWMKFARYGEVTLVLGGFRTIAGSSREGFAAFDDSGILTEFFRQNSSESIYRLVVTPDGQIVTATSKYDGIAAPSGSITQLSESGALVRFSQQVSPSANGNILLAQPDGKVIYGGYYRLYRYNANGSVDTSFGIEGGFSDLSAAALQPDGKLIIVGPTSDATDSLVPTGITRLTAFGAKDASFNASVSRPSTVSGCAVQADGKIVIIGSFPEVNGVNQRYIARLHADGTLDTSFVSPFSPSVLSSRPSLVFVQSDGKILLGGNGMVDANGIALSSVIRLLPDGSLDPEFCSGFGADGQLRAMLLQPDGKILIAGDFTAVHGVSRAGIARLDSNGSLDSTFDPGTGITLWPGYINTAAFNTLALQPDGKVVAGGLFHRYDGHPRNGIVRIETAGPVSAPQITRPANPVRTVEEDGAAVDFDVTASHPEGLQLVWSISPLSKGAATLTQNGTSVRVHYQGGANEYGRETFALIATDPVGRSDSEILAVDIRPLNDPPVNTALPRFFKPLISGIPATLWTGAWNDYADTPYDFPTLSVQWQIADDANGLNAADVPNATSEAYAPTPEQVGKYLRIKVTATDNGVGTPASQSATATSSWRIVLQALSYDTWRTLHFSPDDAVSEVSGKNADPDNDGLINLLEYAFDKSPTTADNSGLPQPFFEIATDPWSPHHMILRYRRLPNALDLNYRAEYSEDLAVWTPLGDPTALENADGSETAIVEVPFMYWTSRAFLRLRVYQK